VQATRERILNILKEQGEATVKELSETLDLTTVTIRHHLDTLRRESLVAPPTVRHRKAPGRPQHVYSLTDEASEFFPKRYERLIDLMLVEMNALLPPEQVQQMMECIGKRMVDRVTVPDEAGFEERVGIAVDFMEERGYMAHWEKTGDGEYLVHVANCPYESVARLHSEVCHIDLTLLTELLGPTLKEITRIAGPARHCTYLLEPAVD